MSDELLLAELLAEYDSLIGVTTGGLSSRLGISFQLARGILLGYRYNDPVDSDGMCARGIVIGAAFYSAVYE